jgi:hypothetical protein
MRTGICNKGSQLTLERNRHKFQKRRHPLHAQGICNKGSQLTLKRNRLKFWKRRHPLTCAREFVTREACQH